MTDAIYEPPPITTPAGQVLTPIPGGWHVKDRDDGNACVDVMLMMYNVRVVLSGKSEHYADHMSIEHGWCYFGHGDGRNMQVALLMAVAAAVAWDGYGAPVGFDKQAC